MESTFRGVSRAFSVIDLHQRKDRESHFATNHK